MPAATRLCLLCVLLLSGIERCAAEEAATPPDDAATTNRILADWKARWERVERVDYRLEGTREYRAGAMTGAPGTPPGPVPEKNIRSRVERRVVMDLRNSRVRHEADRDLFGPSGQAMRTYSVLMYDGEHRVWFAPRDRQAQMPRSVIWPEIHYDYSKHASFFESVDPLAFAHGVVRFSPKPEDVSEPREDAESFKVLRRETFRGRPCTVLTDTTVSEKFPVELWVDEERDSTIVLVKRRLEGRLRETLEVNHIEKQEGWMPDSWTRTQWSRMDPPHPFQIEKLWVKEVTANPELAVQRFRVRPEVGMVYYRTGHEDNWVYQGEGVPPIEVADYWIMKGWATKRSPRQKPLGEPPPVDPY